MKVICLVYLKDYPYISVITGFVFPKISCSNANIYFEKLEEINKGLVSLYAMPILETEDFIFLKSALNL